MHSYSPTSYLIILFILIIFTACQNSQPADKAVQIAPESTSQAKPDSLQIQSITGDSLIRIASESSFITNELIVYIDNLSKTIFDAAGGPLKEDPARPKLSQDSTIATKLLIQQGKGYELMKKLQSTRSELLQLVGSPEELVATLPLKTDFELQPGKNDWVKANFQDVPVALIFPKLKKIKSDARIADKMIRDSLSE